MIIGGYFISKFILLFPKQSFVDVSKQLLGNWLGNIISFLFASYFIIFSGLITRNFSEDIKIFLLDTTPQEVVIMLMLLRLYIQ